MKLDISTVKQITDGLNGLINEYSKDIEDSAEVDGLAKVSLNVKLVEDGPETKVELSIGFTKTKISDKIGFVVSSQQELFDV